MVKFNPDYRGPQSSSRRSSSEINPVPRAGGEIEALGTAAAIRLAHEIWYQQHRAEGESGRGKWIFLSLFGLSVSLAAIVISIAATGKPNTLAIVATFINAGTLVANIKMAIADADRDSFNQGRREAREWLENPDKDKD